MEYIITEKQLKLILSNEVSNQEIGEQTESEPVSSEPTAGTSSTQSGGQGYPSVGKWESGLTRGPANQIGITKWSDVVGSTLKRGKANPLKEQEIGMQPGRSTQIAQTLQAPEIERKNKIKQNFDKNYFVVKTPTTPVIDGMRQVILPRFAPDGTPTEYSVYKHPLDPNKIFKSWVGTEWESYIPSQRHIQDIFPNGTLRSFTIGDVHYFAHLKRVSNDPLDYDFLWYYDKNMKPYNPSDYNLRQNEIPEEYQYDGSWWARWGQWALTMGSILAATFIPGAQGLWLSIGLDLIAAADLSIREKDNVGASISIALAFVPVVGQELLGIGRATGAGKFSEASMNSSTIKKLARSFATLRTEEEVVNKINSLPPSERRLVRNLIKEDPNKVGKLIEREIYRASMKRVVNLEQSKRWVNHLNMLLKAGKINKSGLQWWFNLLGLKRFGWDIGASAIVMMTGLGANTIQNPEQSEDMNFSDSKIKSVKDVSNQDLIDAGFAPSDTINRKPGN